MSQTPTRIILIRHGESTGNAEGRFCGQMEFPLSDLGRTQAALTAARLKDEPITLVYSSDLGRAVETAAPIALAHNLEVRTTPQLRERNMGDLHGMKFEDVQRLFPDQYWPIMQRDADAIPPNGESHRQMYLRVSAELDRIIESHQGEYLVVVAHGLVLHHLFRHIVGSQFAPDGPHVMFMVDNCSVSRFELLENGLWRVKSINETCHLRS